MIVLDTNVLSEFMKSQPDQTVVDWLHAQASDEIWTTSITIFEIRYGLEILPEGRRKQNLTRQFELAIEYDFDNRILVFDVAAAEATATCSANYKREGQGVDFRDMQIAGTVVAASATLATRNTNDFRLAGIPIVNPWEFNAS